MSVLLKLVYDTDSLRQRYVGVHQSLFGLSIERLVRLRGESAQPDYGTEVERLRALVLDLQDVRGQLEELEDSHLSHRTGRQLRTALSEYTVALEDSIRKLQHICQSYLNQQQGVAKFQNYALGDGRADRIAYDDAIQNHKRVGLRVNQLLSNF